MSPVLQILNGISTLSAEDQDGLVQLLVSQQQDRTRLRLLEQETTKADEAIGQEVEQVLAMSMTGNTKAIPLNRLPSHGIRGVDLMAMALRDLYTKTGEAIHKSEWFNHVKVVAAAKHTHAPSASTFRQYLYANHNKWENVGGGMYLPSDSEKEGEVNRSVHQSA